MGLQDVGSAFVFLLGVCGAIFFVYLIVRVGSQAYFRTKREFIDGIRRNFGENDNG